MGVGALIRNRYPRLVLNDSSVTLGQSSADVPRLHNMKIKHVCWAEQVGIDTPSGEKPGYLRLDMITGGESP